MVSKKRKVYNTFSSNYLTINKGVPILFQLIVTIPLIFQFMGWKEDWWNIKRNGLLTCSQRWRHYLLQHIIPLCWFYFGEPVQSDILMFIRKIRWYNSSLDKLPHLVEQLSSQVTHIQCSGPMDVSKFSHLISLEITNDINFQNLPTSLQQLMCRDSKKTYFYNTLTLGSNLTHLTLPLDFDCIVLTLPSSLLYLDLGNTFNNFLILPKSLTYLNLGDKYDHPLTLPLSLTELMCGHNFNQPLSLSFYLQKLTLGSKYSQQLFLLDTLQSIKISPNDYNYVFKLSRLPSNLIELHICGKMVLYDNHLPTTLQSLIIDETNNDATSIHHSISEQSFLHLPPNLRILSIIRFNHNLQQILPFTLRELILSGDFNQSIELPPNLRILSLTGKFNQDLGILPSNLRKLTLGDEFNHPLGMLPEDLDILSIGDAFEHNLEALPFDLQELYLGKSFDHALDDIPDSLYEVHVNRSVVVQSFFNEKVRLFQRLPYGGWICYDDPTPNY